MSASLLAIDESGLQRMIGAVLQGMDNGRSAALAAFAEGSASTDSDKANERWVEFMKSTGTYPYWVNPDGSVLHSLDASARADIQQGAVAVLPVKGMLVKEAWTLEELWYGLVSAERITKFITSQIHDTRIAGVVATVDCPGGQVSGTEKLGNAWNALGAAKRTVMHVDGLAASAAYWFGAGSGSIQMDCRTAYVGSIGVMSSFWDFTPIWEAIGAKYYEIYPKESSNKNEELRELRKGGDPTLYKERLSTLAKLFRAHVTKGRGAKLQTATEPEVLQGRVYATDAALAVGLVDGIADLDGCIALVRAATPTENVPEEVKPEQQIPPASDDARSTASQTKPDAMKLKSMLAALAAALFPTKEEATQEVITEANAELKEKGIEGVAFVSAEEQARLADAAAQISAANTAKEAAEAALAEANTAKDAAVAAQTEAETAKGAAENALVDLKASLQAIATKHNIAVAEGASVEEALGAAIASTSTQLAEAQQEITKLKGEEAPVAGAEGVVNKKGDTNTPVNDGAAKVDQWLQED